MKRSPIRRVSVKRQKQNREYKVLREHYLTDHPRCEIRWDSGCTGLATDIDHVINRSARPDLVNDTDNWQSGCRHCHHMKTINPAEAKLRGLQKSAWEHDGDADSGGVDKA